MTEEKGESKESAAKEVEWVSVNASSNGKWSVWQLIKHCGVSPELGLKEVRKEKTIVKVTQET